MCAIGYCSALHGIPSGNLFWKPWAINVGEDNGDRTALILSHACKNYHILSITNSMWSARF